LKIEPNDFVADDALPPRFLRQRDCMSRLRDLWLPPGVRPK